MELLLEKHSGEVLALILTALVLGTLLGVVPQLLRWHQRTAEMQHTEHMRSLEQGHRIESPDFATRAAGRTATLVPMVAVCAAATVTCFTAVKADNSFSTSLVVWCVAGVISLAAITGGVTLLGRLAGLQMTDEDDERPAK